MGAFIFWLVCMGMVWWGASVFTKKRIQSPEFELNQIYKTHVSLSPFLDREPQSYVNARCFECDQPIKLATKVIENRSKRTVRCELELTDWKAHLELEHNLAIPGDTL